jgi:uncharacterized membrane protein required for colicin V production
VVLDLILVAVLLIATVRGYQRGLASRLIGIAGLITSYLAAFALYRPLGDVVRDQFGWPPLLAYAVAGTVVFTIVGLLFALADGLRVRFMRKHMMTLTALDRGLGATLGLLIGAAYVGVALVLAFLLPPEGALAGMLQTPQSQLLTSARPVTHELTSRVSGLLLGDRDLGRVVSRTLANPAATSVKIRQLLDSPRTAVLMGDHEMMDLVRKGNFKQVMQDERVRKFLEDPASRECVEEFQDDSASPESREATQKVLLKTVARVERLKSSPWAQEILQDQEIQALLKKGDILGLMRNRKLGQLLMGEAPPQDDRQP